MGAIERGPALILEMLRNAFVSGLLLFAPFTVADPFLGLKLGLMDMDENVKQDPFNIALNAGYSLDTWVADFSFVAEYNHTANKGKSRQQEDLELNASSLYLLWKTNRSMYISLRGGAVRNEIVEGGDSQSHAGLLLGAGIGQVIGKSRLQIEYTYLAGDANFVGIGLEFDL